MSDENETYEQKLTRSHFKRGQAAEQTRAALNMLLDNTTPGTASALLASASTLAASAAVVLQDAEAMATKTPTP